MLQVKIKKLNENAVIPHYSREGDCAMDMYATSVNNTKDYIEYDTSIALEIPDGYVGLIFPRSSVSNKDLLLCNSVGIVDSNYRGSIKFRFKLTESLSSVPNIYDIGDRIGQILIIPIPKIKFTEDELSETERNTGGFGSSGI